MTITSNELARLEAQGQAIVSLVNEVRALRDVVDAAVSVLEQRIDLTYQSTGSDGGVTEEGNYAATTPDAMRWLSLAIERALKWRRAD